MNTERIKQLIGVISVGFLLFTGVSLSDATEIKFLKVIYGKSIEREARNITNLALLDSSKIRTQEAIGKVIVKEASEGRMTQEAAVAYDALGDLLMSQIDQRRSETILHLSKAKARTADIIAREEAILGPAAIQRRIQAMNLAKAKQALIDAEALRIALKIEAKDQQADFVRNIVQGAQVNWAIGEMGKGLFASVQGRDTAPISSEVVGIVRSGLGFGPLDDFRFATTLLENETGQPMTQLLPAPVSVASSGHTLHVSSARWGGFVEYGFFAVAGFIFSMWTLAGSAMSDRPPIEGEEQEEEFAEYKKAA